MDSFSVIVTAYNCAGLIGPSLRSVEEAIASFQRHKPPSPPVTAEVVIVDDGSTDGTSPQVAEFTRGKSFWKVVRRNTPSSPSCARNTGVLHSGGAVLFFLDGDDLFLPNHILECYRALGDRGIDFVKTGVRLAHPVHPDWKPRIEYSIPINLCIRRACHEFIGGFPDYHVCKRVNGQLRPETDIFYKIEDIAYNRLASSLFQGKKLAVETVEYCRHPGNGYDRQYEKFCRPFGAYPEVLTADEQMRMQLADLLTKDLLARLKWQRGAQPPSEIRNPKSEIRSPPATLAAARQYHQAGDFREAEQIYRRILQAEPGNAQVWYLLGAACTSLGRLDEAVAGFRQALHYQPNHADAHKHLGVALAQLGRMEEAAAGFRESLRLRPDSAETLNNLGLALKEMGQLDEAASYYQQALRLQPSYAEAHNNLGVLRAAQDQPDAALACYRDALRLKPDFARAQGNLRQLLREQNRHEELLASCRESVERNPGSAEAHNDLGLALLEQGQRAEAEAVFREAIRVNPSCAEAHNNLGFALAAQDQLNEAAVCYHEAVRLKPDFAPGQNNLGIALRRLGRNAEAEASCRQALHLRPNYAEAQNNLGLALLELGRRDEAESCLRESLRLAPDFAPSHNNLGIALWRDGRFTEAEAAYRVALRLRPDFAEASNNLGNVLRDLSRFEEALACFDQALHSKPDYADAHWNRSLVQLLLGNLEEGWPEYEYRWQLKTFIRRPFTQPLWDGGPLEGRTILLHAEQGLGDALQLIRYVPLVKACGGTVVVEMFKPLTKLLAGFPGVDHLVVRDSPLPPFDVHAPLLSLPLLFGTTLANIPADVPYLRADPALVEHWRRELASIGVGAASRAAPGPARLAGPGFKVGIAWQGSKKYRADRWRSIPLAQFAPLAQVPGVQLISLQKGHGSEQVRQLEGRFSVMDLGPRLDEAVGPFMDTAAVMTNVDLVITSDTAIPHLAGALGVPAWVALPVVPDWRWLLERADNPWYPTLRLFRQRQVGDWAEVFEHLAAALAERVSLQREA